MYGWQAARRQQEAVPHPAPGPRACQMPRVPIRHPDIDGAYDELAEQTSLKTFVTSLAGHIAAEAARS